MGPEAQGGWMIYSHLEKGALPRKTKIQRQAVSDNKRKSRSKQIRRFLTKDFLVRISAAGLSRICDRSRTLRRRIAWGILVLVTLLSMTYMTYKVIREYFEYKKTVERTSIIMNSLEFPAVTVCSPVTLPRSRLRAAGLESLLKIEELVSRAEKTNLDKLDGRPCILNPACKWSWMDGKCRCLSNPCQSEYCEGNNGSVCLCSPLLCEHYPGSCFRNSTGGDQCFCHNRITTLNKPNSKGRSTNETDSFLSEIEDEEVRQLLSLIHLSNTDDLSDIQTIYEPDVYSVANYGLKFENMIVGCSFLKQRCGKRNFTVLYTPSHGKCYTFNYAGELSKVPRAPLETKKYGANSGLQLYLQIPEDEIVDILSREIAVTVVVHDPRTLPYVSEYGLLVRPGDSASLRVQRLQINRLGPPWGKCLTSGSHLPFNYSEQPYSQLKCQRKCQNFYIRERCGCMRRTLLPSSVRRPDKPVPGALCNFRIPKQKKCAEDTIEMIENETISCDCYQACKEIHYQTSLTAGHINRDFFRLVHAVKTLRKDGDHLTASLSLERSSILGLKVYYGTLSLQNSTEMPSYSWETLIANIGGNLGFFMGLTLITFLEVAELICDLLLHLIANKSTSKNLVT